MCFFVCMGLSSIINSFRDNAWPHVSRWNCRSSSYESSPHSFYSSDFTPFSKAARYVFFMPKNIRWQRRKTAFKDFLVSKSLEFYRTSINNHRQKYSYVHRSCIKHSDDQKMISSQSQNLPLAKEHYHSLANRTQKSFLSIDEYYFLVYILGWVKFFFNTYLFEIQAIDIYIYIYTPLPP